jgi:integrase
LRRGELPDLEQGRRSFDEWAQHWVDTRQVRDKTRRDYAAIVKNHLLKRFGGQAINRIDRIAVTAYVAELTNDPKIAAGTVASIRRVLSMILNEAARSGAIPRNPADGVKAKRGRREEMVLLRREQVTVLANAIANPVIGVGNRGHTKQDHYPALGFMVRFVSETGLRSGEVAALRVGKVDLERRRVYVDSSATEVSVKENPAGVVYDEPKTYEVRSVPMPLSIAEQMREHLKTRPSDPDAFVFTMVEGDPIRHSIMYNRHWKRALKQSVDPQGNQLVPLNTRFHDLRHTYATLLIAAGANPLTVKQRMGHSSITVTMDRYGHLFPHLEEDLTDRMDEAYRAALLNPMLHADCTKPEIEEGAESAD